MLHFLRGVKHDDETRLVAQRLAPQGAAEGVGAVKVCQRDATSSCVVTQLTAQVVPHVCHAAAASDACLQPGPAVLGGCLQHVLCMGCLASGARAVEEEEATRADVLHRPRNVGEKAEDRLGERRVDGAFNRELQAKKPAASGCGTLMASCGAVRATHKRLRSTHECIVVVGEPVSSQPQRVAPGVSTMLRNELGPVPPPPAHRGPHWDGYCGMQWIHWQSHRHVAEVETHRWLQ